MNMFANVPLARSWLDIVNGWGWASVSVQQPHSEPAAIPTAAANIDTFHIPVFISIGLLLDGCGAVPLLRVDEKAFWTFAGRASSQAPIAVHRPAEKLYAD